MVQAAGDSAVCLCLAILELIEQNALVRNMLIDKNRPSLSVAIMKLSCNWPIG
jgi:hypothetical protein